MMSRCRDCNALLRNDETVCASCGGAAPSKSTGPTLQQRFATFAKIAFFVSLGLTVASLFLSFMPSFTKCAVVSVVLHFVRSSADQMLEKKS